MFKSIGPMELILIVVIILIFFGVGKLPQVGDAMGRAIRAFKKGQSGEDNNAPEEESEKPAAIAASKNAKTGKNKK
jgi:sec-independent protein translocase protein TatA